MKPADDIVERWWERAVRIIGNIPYFPEVQACVKELDRLRQEVASLQAQLEELKAKRGTNHEPTR